MTDLVVRDVRAVLPDGVAHVDISVHAGRIASIDPAGSAPRGGSTVHGDGREAFPGVVDPHAHFRAYPSSAVEGDGFDDLVDSAARGGVTTVLAFVTAPPETVGVAAVEPLVAPIASSPVDVAFHHVLWPRVENLEGIPELVRRGVRSFKVFLAYPERGFMFSGPMALGALDAIARSGGLAMVHAEDGEAIRWLEDRARRRLGATAGIADYAESRPSRLESAAVEQATLWGEITGCPLYLVHISTADGLAAAQRARASGADVTVETCPQYLVLDDSILGQAGPLAKFAPIVRAGRHRDALWEGIASQAVDLVGSDHAGHSGSLKLKTAQESGIFGVPFGSPGIETMLPLLYTHGVRSGRLSRTRLAELLSGTAARRFGLASRKGALRVGTDADIVLVDPDEERVATARELRSTAGYTLYEGMPLRGWPSTTIARGRVVYESGRVTLGGGEFLPTEPVR